MKVNEIVSIKHNIINIKELPFVMFVLFTCTYFVYGDLGVSAVIPGVICIFIVSVSILLNFFQGDVVIIDSIKLSFLWIAVVMLANYLRFDSVHNRINLFYIGIIIFCAMVLLIINHNMNSTEIVLNILLVFSVVVSLYIIFFSIFDDLYRIMIYPILCEKQKQYFDLTSMNGYGVSLGGVTFSAYMIVVGISIAYSNIFFKRSQGKAFYFKQLIICGLLLIALLLLGRKGEMISLLLAFVMMRVIDMFAKEGLINRRGFIIAVMLVMAFALSAALLFPTLLDSGLLDRYVSMLEQVREGKDITSGRIRLWRWGWELFQQNQLFGGGLGSFANFIPETYRVTGAGTAVSSPHIVYLHFLCEFGIVGFVLLMIPFSYILATTLHMNITLSKVQAFGKSAKPTLDILRINTVSLFIQIFYALLFFFDQVISLNHFWLVYSIAICLSSASHYFFNRINKAPRGFSKID